MKKVFNTPFAMLLCMAMAVTFTACEPEPELIDEDERALAFLCDGNAIASGSTYTSSKLDEAYTAMGMTRFVPGIDLAGHLGGLVGGFLAGYAVGAPRLGHVNSVERVLATVVLVLGLLVLFVKVS